MNASHMRLMGLVGLLMLVVAGSAVRIYVALHDPGFNRSSPRGMLRTDPAILYYVTERIIESGGAAPADFRADPRLEYPEKVDFAAIETPGQEFIVAWSYLLCGKPGPLHVFCVWVMGIIASLAVVGVYGLTYEVTNRNHLWALAAATLFTIFPANYRTIGFILIREDFSLPWFALHLWLLVRAIRIRSIASIVAAAITFALAVSTWHAMTFVVACEMAVIFLMFLRSGGRSIFAEPKSWVGLAIIVVAALCLPVLRSKAFLLSLPMLLVWGMLAAGLVERFRGGRTLRLGVAIATILLLFGVVRVVEVGKDYQHVTSMMIAKIRYLGARPADPSLLSPDARLLWSGPFDSARLTDPVFHYLLGLILLIAFTPRAIRDWVHRQSLACDAIWIGAVLSVILGQLVERLFILPGLITPVFGTVALSRMRRADLRVPVALLCIASQAAFFGVIMHRYVIAWYQPPGAVAALRQLIDAVEKQVPPGEPIAADFVTGAAILAETRHPIIQQPKYETARSRERVIKFMTVFNTGTPQEFHDLCRSYGCRYVALNLGLMWFTHAYTAGVPASQARPLPGTAASLFCNPRMADQIPGFKLLCRPTVDQPSDDFFRLYELE